MAKQNQTQGVATPTQVARSKWGDTLINARYTISPNALIEYFIPATGLDSVDLHIIEFLNMRWWKQDSRPMPSKQSIADAVGRDPRTVLRRIARMEKKGLIRRVFRRSATYKNTNIYLLDGLIKVLEPYALKRIKDGNELRILRARQKRQMKKPKLHIVKT